MMCKSCFFFFSSRRRHTRSLRDWSSDVCSSDLGLAQAMVVFAAVLKLAKGHWGGVVIRFAGAGAAFTTVAVVLFSGLIIGRQYIFTWIHEPRPEVGGWLTSRWFFARNGLILVALSW